MVVLYYIGSYFGPFIQPAHIIFLKLILLYQILIILLKLYFLIHQIHTTANFASNNCLLSWFVGFSNYQIEHHLFPNMSHVHYKVVSKVFQTIVKEFSEHSIFIKAILSHGKMLLKLSRV